VTSRSAAVTSCSAVTSRDTQLHTHTHSVSGVFFVDDDDNENYDFF